LAECEGPTEGAQPRCKQGGHHRTKTAPQRHQPVSCRRPGRARILTPIPKNLPPRVPPTRPHAGVPPSQTCKLDPVVLVLARPSARKGGHLNNQFAPDVSGRKMSGELERKTPGDEHGRRRSVEQPGLMRPQRPAFGDRGGLQRLMRAGQLSVEEKAPRRGLDAQAAGLDSRPGCREHVRNARINLEDTPMCRPSRSREAARHCRHSWFRPSPITIKRRHSSISPTASSALIANLRQTGVDNIDCPRPAHAPRHHRHQHAESS